MVGGGLLELGGESDHLDFGSSASRRPSPTKFMLSTLRPIIAVGNTTSHHADSMKRRASFRSRPQLGVGGCTPRPRKLSEASERTAREKVMAACTSTTAKTLGRMSLTRLRALEEPSAAA